MHEIIVNLHMHTPYSDGRLKHEEIAQAAMRSGLDVVITTDHNVWVNGPEGYYQQDEKRVLLLVGEEIHDQAREPQKNHLLVFGAGRELAHLAAHPQLLLDGVKQAGGLAFAAHPVDPAAPAVGESDISWTEWGVQGLNGIELWNGFSEFKSLLQSKLHAVYYAFNPRRVAHGPFPETLKKWDELLASGRKMVAIGGSDAHALAARMGPLRRTLFPYEYHFKSVNTHLMLPRALTGDTFEDRRLVLEALRTGSAFIGYDLPYPTRGFRFTAQGRDGITYMGSETTGNGGVTFQIRLPIRTDCRLLKDGKPVRAWKNRDLCTYITTEPGVYRAEAYVHFLGRRRGWIFTNPIYVR